MSPKIQTPRYFNSDQSTMVSLLLTFSSLCFEVCDLLVTWWHGAAQIKKKKKKESLAVLSALWVFTGSPVAALTQRSWVQCSFLINVSLTWIFMSYTVYAAGPLGPWNLLCNLQAAKKKEKRKSIFLLSANRSMSHYISVCLHDEQRGQCLIPQHGTTHWVMQGNLLCFGPFCASTMKSYCYLTPLKSLETQQWLKSIKLKSETAQVDWYSRQLCFRAF